MIAKLRPTFVIVLLLATAASAATPQSGPTDLPVAPFGSMHMLLEKSIFRVDVLTLDVQVGQDAARRIGGVVKGHRYSEDVADAIANVVMSSAEVLARIRFVREIRLGQFLDGIDDDMQRAVEVGWLQRADYERIRRALPQWFAFLDARRILEGDEITYRVLGDSVVTVYRDAGGRVLLEQTDTGGGARESVLGTYFAPASSFRRKLVDSLFERP